MGKLLPRFSVQKKMFMVLGGGIFGFIVYFCVNHFILQKNRDTLQRIVELQLPALELSEDLINEISRQRGIIAQAVISQNLDGLGKSEESNKKIGAYFDKWAENAYINKDLIAKVHLEYAASYASSSDAMQNVIAGLSVIKDSQSDFQKSISSLSGIEQSLKDIKTNIGRDLEMSVGEAVVFGKRAMYFGIILMIVGLFVSVVFYFVMVEINKSLLNTNGGIQDISKRLLDMVQEAQVSSQSLRSSANKQAASSTETVISMEQMKRILTQTSRSSSDARDLSEASLTEATNGKDLVQSLKESMIDIENSNKDLQEVTEVVKLVREHTRIINEIVFKTQLLSFNANIEAARAGQHGLGFAVVANEIGNLAEMSGRAAEEINDLLEKSTVKVDHTITNTKSKVAKANDLSARCYDFFTLITERSSQLKQMINSISQATSEQSTGVEYVVDAMNELSQTASETDRMAHGLSTLADGLKNQSLSLNHAAEDLNAFVRGSASFEHGDKEDNATNGETALSDDMRESA